MKAYEIRDGFGLDHLLLSERPAPTPGPGEVVVRVRATSLNYRDLLTVTGHYNPKQKLPLVPCSDAAGEVVAVGGGVSSVAVGDRVMTLFAPYWQAGAPTRQRLRNTLGGPLDGTLAERILLPAEGVVPLPPHLSYEAAATLPCAALTAWSALVTHGGVTAGDTVLVQGTGGVSIFALQIGLLLGARVIVTSKSDAKLERAKELGAWRTINYRRTPQWGVETRRLTGGRGVDHVVEVGGAGTLEQSLQAIRFGGTISVIGVLAGVAGELSIIPILMQHVRLQGILVGHREGCEAMCRAFDAHRLEPVIDRVFPFDEAPDALRYLAGGEHFGKIVVRGPADD
ncbi:MAG: NAD(P)-dependent alcohol dehydrogenase [Acidobacteria bacterium]|nr:MAG: NAD(P)-dependent alcohol dehydrogenase [Acidobacteriota bacterium]